MLAWKIVILCMHAWIIYYLHRMKTVDCQCALSWQRKYIMVISGILVIKALVMVFAKDLVKPYTKMLLPAIIALGVLNVVLIFQYVDMLKKTKCSCISADAVNFLRFVAIVYTIIYVIAFVCAVLLLFYFKTTPL